MTVGSAESCLGHAERPFATQKAARGRRKFVTSCCDAEKGKRIRDKRRGFNCHVQPPRECEGIRTGSTASPLLWGQRFHDAAALVNAWSLGWIQGVMAQLRKELQVLLEDAAENV